MRYLLVFLIIFFLVSCSGDRKAELFFKKVEMTRQVSIKTPSGYEPDRNYKWSFQSNKDERHLVRATNTQDGLLLNVLDLDALLIRPSIRIPTQGPNGHQSSSPSFYYHNEDSIFVLTTSLNRILLYNSESVKLNRIDLKSDLTLSLDTNGDQQSFIVSNDQIIGHAIPYLNPNNKDFFKKTSNHIRVDLSNGRVRGVRYPDILHGKILPTDFLGGQTVKLNDSEYLFSDYRSHSVQLFNLKDDTSRPVEFGLPMLEEFSPMSRAVDNGSMDKALMVFRSMRYYAIVYDTQNEIFYRFAKFLNPKYSSLSDSQLLEELGKENSDVAKNVVVVANNDFSKLEYFEMPQHDFYAPIKNGLLVPSPDEPGIDEEKFLIYDLSEIIKSLNQ